MSSDVEKALTTVKVSERKLSKLPEPQRSWQITNRKIAKRNSLIYRDWLDAEDKDAAIELLCERWGFKRRGDVLRIIEKGKSGVIVAMAADVKVLRQVKREEVLREFESWRAEIDLQLKKLRIMRNSGKKTVEIEITDEAVLIGDVGSDNDDADKVPVKVKTKRVRIDTEIRRLEAERAKSHTPEAAALADYTAKQVDGQSGFQRGVEASIEFVEAFSRLGRVVPSNEPIEVESEVVGD